MTRTRRTPGDILKWSEQSSWGLSLQTKLQGTKGCWEWEELIIFLGRNSPFTSWTLKIKWSVLKTYTQVTLHSNNMGRLYLLIYGYILYIYISIIRGKEAMIWKRAMVGSYIGGFGVRKGKGENDGIVLQPQTLLENLFSQLMRYLRENINK